MIPWLAIAVGCVAIWPVTVPKQSSHKGVAMLCPPVEDSHNLGKKAQKDVDVVGQFVSGASISYMTRLGMSTQWTMQVNCMSPSTMNQL